MLCNGVLSFFSKRPESQFLQFEEFFRFPPKMH